MLERARWRPYRGMAWTPLGRHFGTERWLFVPVALWLVVYSGLVWSLVLFLERPFGTVILTASLMPLFGFDQRDKIPKQPQLPEKKAPTKNRLLRTLVLFEEDTELLSLSPVPSPGASYPVSIVLKRGWWTTGEDRGVVVFEEGWLVYEGVETSFALSPSDVLRGVELKDGSKLTLNKEQTLLFKSWDHAEWQTEVAAWLKSAPPEGLSRQPPLLESPYRKYLVAARLHVGACMLIGAVLAGSVVRLFSPIVKHIGFGSAVPFAMLLFFAGGILWIRNHRQVE